MMTLIFVQFFNLFFMHSKENMFYLILNTSKKNNLIRAQTLKFKNDTFIRKVSLVTLLFYFLKNKKESTNKSFFF